MTVAAGSTILASDVISTSAGAGDSGKIPKLNASGKIDTSFMKFGGTGADGALAISSGTTTIDCANAALVIKNYSSISITSTGKLAFSNPHANGTIVILKSLGNVTLSSSTVPCIDLVGMGAAAGTGPGQNQNGNPGSAANSTPGYRATGFGLGGIAINTGGTAATPGATTAYGYIQYPTKTIPLVCGTGGGAGGGTGGSGGRPSGGSGGSSINSGGSDAATPDTSGSNGTGSTGGRGGGALLIECGGTYANTTATISTAGAAGSAGAGGVGAGGGGGAGTLVVLYNILGSDSGTYTVAGGAGGGTANTGGAGGASISYVGVNNDFA